MRQDKLTTKFQEALGDAQSLALAHDNQFLEPVHLLAAILHDKDGSAVSLLERAGVNVPGLTPGRPTRRSKTFRRFPAPRATSR